MYIVLEIQTMSDEQIGTLVNSYTNREAAENKFHTVLAAAAVSTLPVHSAVMMTEDGYVVKNEAYYHPLEEIEEG